MQFIQYSRLHLDYNNYKQSILKIMASRNIYQNKNAKLSISARI